VPQHPKISQAVTTLELTSKLNPDGPCDLVHSSAVSTSRTGYERHADSLPAGCAGVDGCRGVSFNR